MSGAPGLDVRLPIGGLFTVLGLLLAGYGIATNSDAARYERSLSVNINLWWGLTMLLFGLVVLLAAWRGRTVHRGMTGASTEGLATEAREHRLGLEHEQ
jgi:hypothetical protein